MRQLTVSIGVGDQQGRYFEDLEATVNTRSTFTAIPRTLLQKLGVPVTRSARARLADGTTAPIDLGCVLIRLDGQVFPTQVIFAEDDQNSVLGRVTLEAALLAVDPQQQCLVPVDLDISRPRHLSNNAEPDNGPWDNLDALFADAELPFGHPGRNFDDSPARHRPVRRPLRASTTGPTGRGHRPLRPRWPTSPLRQPTAGPRSTLKTPTRSAAAPTAWSW